LYRERKPDGSAPSIVIDSIDLKKLLDLTGAGHLDGLTSYLVGEVRLLARAKEDECVQGVILGGTELPFILKGGMARGIPLLDTTRIHVEAALDELLGTSP
jgi:aspartate/glutamate racemase